MGYNLGMVNASSLATDPADVYAIEPQKLNIFEPAFQISYIEAKKKLVTLLNIFEPAFQISYREDKKKSW